MVLVASKMRPNTALELTPLCGPKIMAILKADIGSIAISVYGCGAAQRQAVRRAPLNPWQLRSSLPPIRNVCFFFT
jgi:hypothetical protein